MQAVRQKLAQAGHNLWASLPLDSLSSRTRQLLVDSHAEAEDYEYLLLLGSHGKRYWEAAQPLPVNDLHPIDQYVCGEIRKHLAAVDYRILYPGDHLLPLTDLGRLAGWHNTSPLGLGIHPKHGLWFAYRALLLANAVNLETELGTGAARPCESCSAQPCIAACPAGAVAVDLRFILTHIW
jgi:hypothetical protein